MTEVKVKLLRPGAVIPAYATEGSSGMDLVACLGEEVVIAPGERKLIPTGIAVQLPPECEMQVRPRSGLALRTGVTVLNSPGTIDADYRGEVGVLLVNLGAEPGDRIAQAVIAPVTRARMVVAEELEDTGRGAGGFGHTGYRKKGD